jgi:hypothetical protein
MNKRDGTQPRQDFVRIATGARGAVDHRASFLAKYGRGSFFAWRDEPEQMTVVPSQGYHLEELARPA